MKPDLVVYLGGEDFVLVPQLVRAAVLARFLREDLLEGSVEIAAYLARVMLKDKFESGVSE